MSALSVRRPLALLAVLGMVAALLFAVVGTAGAADPVEPNSLALFSACPDNADIPDPGFSDIPSGSYLSDSVDCLAYYAVTVGTTPDTYSPGDPVTRLQMAVFLYRMAPSAGVEFNVPVTAPFTDIAGASQEAQDAINHLASIDVVHGTTATTFSPDNPVTRQQMAQFLARYSDAPDDGHGAPDHGPGGSYADQTDGRTDGTKTNFTDIAGATGDAVEAITAVFHLGVAAGTTATTYDPTGVVTRGQMSLFITRLMGQMNTRPAGVNIQANPMTVEGDIQPLLPPPDPLLVTYSVTARNADFSWDMTSRIDAFKFYADNATDTPFKTDGTCDTAKAEFIQPVNIPVCTLTSGDPNAAEEFGYGNLYVAQVLANTAFTTLYAWTGPLDSAFYSGTTYSSVQIAGEKPAPTWDWVDLDADVAWVDDDGDDGLGWAHLGDTVTWTAQLMDSDDVPFAEAGVEITFYDDWGTGDAPIPLPPIAPADSSSTTTVVETDATGKATYTKTETVVSYHWIGVEADGDQFDDLGVQWSDAASAASEVVLSTPTLYKVIATPPAPNTNTMTATVYDQYGALYTGPGTIQFQYQIMIPDWVDVGGPLALNNGVVTRTFTWDPSTYQKSWTTLRAVLAAPAVNSNEVDFYWVVEAEKTDAPTTPDWLDVRVADIANKAVVLDDHDGGRYLLFTWDAGDQFKAIDTAGSNALPTDMAGFEEQLVKGNHDQVVKIPFYDPAGMSDFRVRPHS